MCVWWGESEKSRPAAGNPEDINSGSLPTKIIMMNRLCNLLCYDARGFSCGAHSFVTTTEGLLR